MWFRVISACSCNPAAKAADAASTSWPPMEIQPVNQAAVAWYDAGVRQWTQWYCPLDVSMLAAIGRDILQHGRTSGGRIYGCNLAQ